MHEDVVAVCAPSLITRYFPDATMININSFDLSAQQLIELPLLQQTTRPHIWEEWFNLHPIKHPNPNHGQRHELFSMLAVAANHGMGMALIPQMLIKKELQKKELVMVSTKKLEKKRAYYLIHSSQENSPLIEKFVGWIQQEVKE